MDPTTPIFVRGEGDPDFPSRSEAVYYVLAGNGLFIGRNTVIGAARLRSVVPAPQAPAELPDQRSLLVLDYPRLPAADVARVTGFFWQVARVHGAEAMVLLALNESGDGIDLIVPEQNAGVGRTWRGDAYPIDLRYEWNPPAGVTPPRIIGDIHSHGHEGAYASHMDKMDEVHAPGIHIVMGRVDRDPPEIHAEFVVDGTRFKVPPESVLDLDGYPGRDEATPAEWMDRVEVTSFGAVESERHDVPPESDNGYSSGRASGDRWS